MSTYRQKQLAAAALIESGSYTAEQIAEIYGWTRAAPERSAQTGHNQTLTPRRKCGIIKAMRRYVRHRKHKKQEEKKMEKNVKIIIGGETVGTILTNRSLTVSEAMWSLGYDISDSADIERGYNDGVPGFYLDDCGNYQFDEETVQIIY